MTVEKVMRTQDGKLRIFLHDDQTAELWTADGQRVMGRVQMHRVSTRLAELGYGGGDLVED